MYWWADTETSAQWGQQECSFIHNWLTMCVVTQIFSSSLYSNNKLKLSTYVTKIGYQILHTTLVYVVILKSIYTKTASCEKRVQPQNARVKKIWNQRWRPRNGCDNSSMAKFLITTIQVNLCVLLQVSLGLSTKFNWIVVIKIFAIELLSQPFLGCHLWFHVFFHPGILGPHPFFTACCFYIDITSFCNCIFIIYQSWP